VVSYNFNISLPNRFQKLEVGLNKGNLKNVCLWHPCERIRVQKLVLKVGRGMARLDVARNEYIREKLRGL
jgi:hypothetical protein